MKALITWSSAEKELIARALGSGWRVLSADGFCYDLPGDDIGLSVPGFSPVYQQTTLSRRVSRELQRNLEGIDVVAIHVPPGRRGEYEAVKLLSVLERQSAYLVRILDMSPDGIKRGLASATPISPLRYVAAECQRVLERIVGYRVSPVLNSLSSHRKPLSVSLISTPVLMAFAERPPAEYAAQWCGEFISEQNRITGELASSPFSDDEISVVRGLLLDQPSFSLIEGAGEPHSDPAPPPLTTAALVSLCYRELGLLPAKTLDIAKRLFLAAKITYPWTASKVLDPFTAPRLKSAVFGNDASHAAPDSDAGASTDHASPFAISPVDPLTQLTGFGDEERSVYELILKASLAAIMPASQYTVVTSRLVSTLRYKGRPVEFSFQSRRIESPGWTQALSQNHPLPLYAPPRSTSFRLDKMGQVQKQTTPDETFVDVLLACINQHPLIDPHRIQEVFSYLFARDMLDIDQHTASLSAAGRSVYNILHGTLTFLRMDKVRSVSASLDSVESGQAEANDLVYTFARQIEDAISAYVQDVEGKSVRCPFCYGGTLKRRFLASEDAFTWRCSNKITCGKTLPDDPDANGLPLYDSCRD